VSADYADQWRDVDDTAYRRPSSWCVSCGYHPTAHAGAHRYDCSVSPPPVTKPQLARLGILRSTVFDGDRTKWFAWVQTNIHRAVTTNRDLTKREAMALIDAASAGDEPPCAD
jgi:hypothetical protein